MDLRKVNHKRLSVIVPLIAGVITVIVLLVIQDPVYGTDGILRFKNSLDPHLFILYTALAVTVSLALVDFVYWLTRWCQEQSMIEWCQKQNERNNL